MYSFIVQQEHIDSKSVQQLLVEFGAKSSPKRTLAISTDIVIDNDNIYSLLSDFLQTQISLKIKTIVVIGSDLFIKTVLDSLISIDQRNSFLLATFALEEDSSFLEYFGFSNQDSNLEALQRRRTVKRNLIAVNDLWLFNSFVFESESNKPLKLVLEYQKEDENISIKTELISKELRCNKLTEDSILLESYYINDNKELEQNIRLPFNRLIIKTDQADVFKVNGNLISSDTVAIGFDFVEREFIGNSN